MIIKLTVQGNIWISNKSRLIMMVTIYGNRYRSMVCLYMFLKQEEIVIIQRLLKRLSLIDGHAH